MRKVVLVIVGLLAVFTALRAYSQEGGRFTLHPSEISFTGGGGSLDVSFGLIDALGQEPRLWSVFPVRISVASGDSKAHIALNGFSLLTRRGVSVGVPVNVRSPQTGDVVSIGGDVEVDAPIEGNVWSLGGSIRLTPRARVSGNVVCLGGTIDWEDGAVVDGSRVELEGVRVPLVRFITSAHAPAAILLLVQVLRIAVFLALAFVFLHFLPGAMAWVVSDLQRWRAAVLYGLCSLIGVPILAILLVLSRVGLLFLPTVALSMILLFTWGGIAASVRVGTWLGLRGYIAAVVGFAIISAPSLLAALLGLISSPRGSRVFAVVSAVGGGLYYLAGLWGWSGTLASLRRRGASPAAGLPPANA